MPSQPHSHPIPLDPRVTVTAARKEFRHGYSYQAPVNTDFFGRVSGGGTQGGSFLRTGFSLRITNHENAMRSYYFSVAVFSDHASKLVKQTIPRHVAHVHPGHTVEVDIELADRGDFANTYLIDFVISVGNEPRAHFTPDYPLALAAEPDGPGEEDDGLGFFYWLVTMELLLFGLGLGALAHFGYHISGLWSWLLGIGAFIGGLYLTQLPITRGALYTGLSAIWGFYTWVYVGLLEAIGVTALVWFIHWRLRAPARKTRKKMRAAQKSVARR